MKKVILIALYDLFSKGVRGLHSYLEGQGHEVHSVYFKSSTYTQTIYKPDEMLAMVAKIKEIDPDFIGIAVRSPVFPVFVDFCNSIRAEIPKAQIIAGGAHATADPDSCLEHADHVVIGDGENAMRYIIDGIDGSKIGPYPFDDLDSLPFPHYGGNCYALSTPTTYDGKMSVYSTRGCFYSCAYCQESLLRRKPVRKSVKYFKEEIEHLLKLFPSTKIFTISDSVFTYDMDWLEEFAREFSGFNGLRFWCATNAKLINDDVLRLLKDAHVDAIRVGVQSANKEIRDMFGRKETLDEILEAAMKIHSMNMTGHYDFIVENPYENAESLKQTRSFIRKLPFSAITNKFEMRYWPGTEFTKKALADGHINPEDVSGQFMRFGNWTYTYQVIG